MIKGLKELVDYAVSLFLNIKRKRMAIKHIILRFVLMFIYNENIEKT